VSERPALGKWGRNRLCLQAVQPASRCGGPVSIPEWSRGICGEQSGRRKDSPSSTYVFPSENHSTNAPPSYSSIYYRCYILVNDSVVKIAENSRLHIPSISSKILGIFEGLMVVTATTPASWDVTRCRLI